MPRWPEGYIPKSRRCPKCGGKKVHYAKTCRRCQERPKGQLGKKGPDHPAWKGGQQIDRDGYIRLYRPDHPWPRKSGYVLEHVAIIELEIGRRLTTNESVHHKDGNKQNNDRSNLEVLSRGEHAKIHRKADTHLRKRDSRGRFMPH